MPETMTITMAPSGNHGGKRMWPSLETASHIADVANIFLSQVLSSGLFLQFLLFGWRT
jgi:hypothetical protein